MINIVTNASTALLVLFAAHKLGVTDVGLGVLFASASAGVVVFGVLAGRIRRLFTFSQAILGSLVADGLLLAAFGLCRWFPLSVMLWGLGNGLGIFFNINTRSLRQLITPPELLGRVMSIASVLAWSAIPLGTLAGGALVSAGLDVGVLYVASGILVAAIAGMFALGPLGRAQRYVPELTGGRASAAVAAPDAPVR